MGVGTEDWPARAHYLALTIAMLRRWPQLQSKSRKGEARRPRDGAAATTAVVMAARAAEEGGRVDDTNPTDDRARMATDIPRWKRKTLSEEVRRSEEGQQR